MEAEEREAQSAKLQELIRRGGPQDLQEANKLMKVMAGYDQRNKTDWRAKAAEEVGKIQQKARLLEEMLQGYKPGDQLKEGDVFEVRHKMKNARAIPLNASRNLQVLSRMHSLRSTRCAKRTQKTQRPWQSYSKSTTAYIAQYKDTSSSRRATSMVRTRFRRAHLDAVALESSRARTIN